VDNKAADAMALGADGRLHESQGDRRRKAAADDHLPDLFHTPAMSPSEHLSKYRSFLSITLNEWVEKGHMNPSWHQVF
jgi:hypothetical protein